MPTFCIVNYYINQNEFESIIKLYGNFVVEKIRLSKSIVGVEEISALSAVIQDGYLSMGPRVRAFEKEIALFVGVPFENVCCVSSGTAALHLALEALDLGPYDEVIVPSLTYVASFQAISASGAVPVACDIDLETGLLCLKSVRKLINKNTKVIMPVHYASSCESIEKVYELAKEFNLRVIEDAAHSFGGKYKGQKIGSKGDIVAFSFDGIKNITSGEGGCIISDDNRLMDRIRDSRLLGVVNDSDQREKKKRSWDFNVVHTGYRYHMSDLMAAIGIEQLKKLSSFSSKRQLLVTEYVKYLRDIDGIKLVRKDYRGNIPHIFPILVNKTHRDSIRSNMLELGIETGSHYKANHLLDLFSRPGTISLPCAEEFSARVITLPLHPDLSFPDIKLIAESLKYLVQTSND